MEFHQVRYFLALSKSLNFTRAAEVCNVTQPALSKAIQKLEDELGGKLVFRERQLTQMTELGNLVLPALEKMLAAAEAASADARDFHQKAIAPIKIGLTPRISANLIVALLSQMAALVPGLQIELIEAPETDMPQMLLDGSLNAAFTGGSKLLPERIDHWSLFDESFRVLVSTGSSLARMPVVPLGILKDQVWLERAGCNTLDALWRRCMQHAEPPRILHRGRREAHLHEMVAAGMGILLTAEHVEGPPNTVGRPIEGDPLRHTVSLLAVAGRRYTPALDALIKTSRIYDWKKRRSEFGAIATPPVASRATSTQASARLAEVA